MKHIAVAIEIVPLPKETYQYLKKASNISSGKRFSLFLRNQHRGGVIKIRLAHIKIPKLETTKHLINEDHLVTPKKVATAIGTNL